MSPYYFVSFPKSGRTWVKSFLASYNASYFELPVFYDFSPLWRRGSRSKVPRIVFSHARHRGEGDAAVHLFIKRIRDKKVVYWVRDPRRVVFSYYFQLVKRMGDPGAKAMSLSQFVRDQHVGLPRIIKFMNEWYSSRQCFANFALFQYEEVVSDPLRQFTRLLEFLQTPVSAELIEEALARSVDTTRKIEEGGLVPERDLVDAVARGTPYFETADGSTGSVKRYGGDNDAFIAAFSEEDLAYMTAELDKLDPAFGYGREEF
jgi:hypothetical protein